MVDIWISYSEIWQTFVYRVGKYMDKETSEPGQSKCPSPTLSQKPEAYRGSLFLFFTLYFSFDLLA